MSKNEHQRAIALPAHKVEDLMSAGSDRALAEYIITGEERHRQGAENAALGEVWALCEALTCIEETERVTPENWSQVAQVASTLIQRVIMLHGYGEAEHHE